MRRALGPQRRVAGVLLGHYMLTRGGDRRATEISDLHTFEFPGEGPTRYMPLIFTTRADKENQHGRLETAGALRNRKPLVCMLSGLAFYLLYRWDLTDEPFPDFSQRAAWYDTRLLKSTSGDRTAELAYNTQRDWVTKAFGHAGVTSQKKTHVPRSGGAKTAELKGASEVQIRRAGRWNQEHMVSCYLNSLPRKFHAHHGRPPGADGLLRDPEGQRGAAGRAAVDDLARAGRLDGPLRPGAGPDQRPGGGEPDQPAARARTVSIQAAATTVAATVAAEHA